jgi:hypothetical protein
MRLGTTPRDAEAKFQVKEKTGRGRQKAAEGAKPSQECGAVEREAWEWKVWGVEDELAVGRGGFLPSVVDSVGEAARELGLLSRVHLEEPGRSMAQPIDSALEGLEFAPEGLDIVYEGLVVGATAFIVPAPSVVVESLSEACQLDRIGKAKHHRHGYYREASAFQAREKGCEGRGQCFPTKHG